jgi:Anti-sigma factor NepR
MICNRVESSIEHMRSPAFDSAKLQGNIPPRGGPLPKPTHGSWSRPIFPDGRFVRPSRMVPPSMTLATHPWKPTYEIALVAMERRPTPKEMKALVDGIGTGLRTQHCDVLCGEIPDRIAQLLRQLDEATAANLGPSSSQSSPIAQEGRIDIPANRTQDEKVGAGNQCPQF